MRAISFNLSLTIHKKPVFRSYSELEHPSTELYWVKMSVSAYHKSFSTGCITKGEEAKRKSGVIRK